MKRLEFIRLSVMLVVALGGLIAVTSSSTAESAEQIELLTYHTHEPFITGDRQGLSYDLATFLSDHSDGAYRFEVIPASRPRIDRILQQGKKKAVIPWVNPVWFKDSERKIHLWSDTALMRDGNAIISHQRRPVDYNGPEVLDGMVLGGIAGHQYSRIDDFIKKGGALRRVNADNHTENISKLRRGDIDAMLMPDSGARFTIRKAGLTKELYVSPSPHSTFDRHLLIMRRDAELARFLDDVLTRYASEWEDLVNSYQ
jgi:polar amino acid transport system substrate-binding protein